MIQVPFLSLKDVTNMHGEEIREAARRVIDSGWYLQGKENELFEQHYADFIGTRYCIGCANGLDALIWIFRAYIELGAMQPGDEVIVPANTYIATILAITENGLKPVLIEPRRLLLEKIGVLLPPQRGGGIMTETVTAVKECCELYSVPYYDMSGQGQIPGNQCMPISIAEQNLPKDGYGQIYFGDNVHFSQIGKEQFYHKYARFLERLV